MKSRALLCLILVASYCAPGRVVADHIASITQVGLMHMDYQGSDDTGGLFLFDIASANSARGTTVFFNAAGDLNGDGVIGSGEWFVQNLPIHNAPTITGKGAPTNSGLIGVWFDPEGSAGFEPAAMVQVFATIEVSPVIDPNNSLDFWFTDTLLVVGETWGINDPLGQIPEPFVPGLSTSAGVYARPLLNVVPDIAQRTNECGPTSAANSLIWLANEHEFQNLLPATNDALILELMQNMAGNQTRPFAGLRGDQLKDGKESLIEARNLPLVVKGGLNDENAKGGKAFDFITKEIDAGEDVEFLIKWPGANSGSHWVTAVGYAIFEERLFLTVNDPDDGHTGQVIWELQADGNFVSPRGQMLWAVSESPAPIITPLLPDLSGTWFDPVRDNQGFIFLPIDLGNDKNKGTTGQVLVYWFTYDETGAQRWMFGVASVSGATLTIDSLFDSSGGIFGPNFDPGSVSFAAVGQLSLTSTSCNRFDANYTVDGVSGTFALERLSGIDGLSCGTQSASGFSGRSGAWFDPTHDGEGFIVNILSPTLALIYWFTYDSQGNQAWFLGLGDIVGERITINQMSISSGGNFGPTYEPGKVTFTTWGTAEFNFSCQAGSMSYSSSLPGFPGGSQTLQPLSMLAGLACE